MCAFLIIVHCKLAVANKIMDKSLLSDFIDVALNQLSKLPPWDGKVIAESNDIVNVGGNAYFPIES